MDIYMSEELYYIKINLHFSKRISKNILNKNSTVFISVLLMIYYCHEIKERNEHVKTSLYNIHGTALRLRKVFFIYSIYSMSIRVKNINILCIQGYPQRMRLQRLLFRIKCHIIFFIRPETAIFSFFLFQIME